MQSIYILVSNADTKFLLKIAPKILQFIKHRKNELEGGYKRILQNVKIFLAFSKI